MSVRQKTVTLNDFGDGSFERRTRTSSSGNTSDRYSVTIDAKPIKLDFDTKTLGAGVAQAITEHLRKRVSEISAEASPATQLRRKYAADALVRGERWAMKRYAGGRTGVKPPNQSSRLFNDSGRLAAGIAARPTRDNNWVVNVPSNRFRLETESATMRMIDRLRQYVPEFGSASRLLAVATVQQALHGAAKAIIAKGPQGNQHLRELVKELTKLAIDTISKSGED